MKLTKFTVFIILLVVLIISLFFSNWVPVEPFISYNYAANTNISSNQVSVPPYSTSKSIYKVYDSIYYDAQNGNVVELFGTPYTNKVDTTGQSLTNMIIMPRVGSLVVEYDAQNSKGSFSNVAESNYLNAQLTPTYTSWYYPNTTNTSSKLANSIEYQVFCFPWKMDTVLFVNNIMKKSTVGIFSYMGSGTPDGLVKTVNYTANYNINNQGDYNFYMTNGGTIPGYSGSVSADIYKVYSNIWFDTKSGSIIYYDDSRGANSSANVDTSLQFNYSNRNYTIIYTTANSGNIILGIPFSSNRTMIVVLGADQANNSYLNILNVIRFDPSMPNGIDTSMKDSGVKTNPPTNAPVQDNTCNTPASSCNAPQPPASPFAFNPSDYIAKTQIVPPVCPACPAIPAMPTQPPATDSLVNVIKQLKDLGVINPPQPTQSVSQQQGGVQPTNPGWGLANNILNNTGNVLTNAENIIGNTAGGAISGATQLGTGAISGATQLGTGAIGGATQLGTGAIGGATELGTGVIGGATNLGVGAENVIGSVASNVANVASNAIAGATALGLGAENVVGNVATNIIGGATSLGLGAENIVGGAVNTAGGVVGKTLDTASGVVNKTIDTAGNVVGTTVTSAENVIEGAEQAIGNIGSGPVNLNRLANTQKPSTYFTQPPPPPQAPPTAAPPQEGYPGIEIGQANLAGNIAGGTINKYAPTCKPQEEEYEYVYEEIVPDDYYNRRREPPQPPAPPTPQIIYIQAPTPSVALMSSMPAMPDEDEIYECEDEEEEEEEPRPSRKRKNKRDRIKDSTIDNDMYSYYYNVPPGPGSNGYFGNIKNTTMDFMPMSSDFSKFGR